jgi:DNA-binding SARP family transcriptional activator
MGCAPALRLGTARPLGARWPPLVEHLRARVGSTYGRATISHPDERALGSASRLLDRGRYAQAADVLAALERTHQAAGDAVEAEILAAARRLCLACQHHREELEAQHEAAAASAGMERRLRDRLAALLDLAATRSLIGPLEPAPPASTAPVIDAAPERNDAREVLAVQCLGPFCVMHGERRLEPWPSRRAKAVFKYLVVHRERPVAKETLMDVFWPDTGVSAARNNLNVAVHSLRRFLRDAHTEVSHVVFRDGSYLIDPALPVWVDAAEFERLADAGEQHERAGRLPEAVRDLHAAEALYQGGLFDDDPYEEWMLARRRELQDRYVGVLERLGELYRVARDDRGCLDVARKVVAVEPFREAAHRELMRCYARQGQQHLALRQFLDCAAALQDVLDTRPEPQTLELYERIRRHEPV